MRYVIPLAGSGSVLGSPPSWLCLKCSQEASYQTPNHLIWLHLTWRSSSSMPKSVWMFLNHSGVLDRKKRWSTFVKMGPTSGTRLEWWGHEQRSGGRALFHGTWPKKNIGTQPGKTTWSHDEGQQDLVQFVPGGGRRWGPGHPDTWHCILVPSDRYACLF